MIKNIKDFIHKDEKFLDEWANGDSGFVRDGVVNPETYFSDGLRYRILYLFKEVNDYYGDLREVLRDAKRKPTWNNVARWTEGILNLDKIFLWKDVQDIDDDYRKSALSKIASIN